MPFFGGLRWIFHSSIIFTDRATCRSYNIETSGSLYCRTRQVSLPKMYEQLQSKKYVKHSREMHPQLYYIYIQQVSHEVQLQSKCTGVVQKAKVAVHVDFQRSSILMLPFIFETTSVHQKLVLCLHVCNAHFLFLVLMNGLRCHAVRV